MLKKFSLLILILVSFILPSGCIMNKRYKLKSPCIKYNDSVACIDRYPINSHWLKLK
jgi:hypothetical protein